MRCNLLAAALTAACIAASPMSLVDLLTLDCAGAVHVAVNTPLEAHLATPIKWWWDAAADEMRALAMTLRDSSCPALSNETLEALYVPSADLLVNAIMPAASRAARPPACDATWKGSSTLLSDSMLSKLTELYQLPLPDTCSLASLAAGKGCLLSFTEAVSQTSLHLALDRCPNSAMPFISLSLSGSWATYAFRPCAKLGSSDECGGGVNAPPPGPRPHGAPLTCRTFSGNQDELWHALRSLNLVSSDADGDLALCGEAGLSGKDLLTRKLRAALHAAAGLIPPPNTASPVAFCMPSNDTLRAVGDWFTSNASQTQKVPLPAEAGACLAAGCSPSQVGDGVCHTACYSAACRWDGGDCGHAPAVWPPFIKAAVVGSKAPYIITPEEAGVAGMAGGSNLTLNLWEPCNGVPGATPSFPVGTCNCPQNRAPPGWTPVNATNKCAGFYAGYCDPGSPFGVCNRTAPPAAATLLSGVAAAMSAWGGRLGDEAGASALSPDRKSGAAWPVPGALLDTGERLPASWLPAFYATCSGELGVHLGNDALAAALSLPVLPTGLAFLYEWVREVNSCRARRLAAMPLSPEQFELRFGVWHLAKWAYEYSTMGPGLANATLGALWLKEAGIGSRAFPDWLLSPKEPDGAPIPEGILRASAYARAWRMLPPAPEDCSFDSLSIAGRTSRGDRRCRLSYASLGSLLSPAGRPALPATLHMELRQDACGGAALPLPNALGSATLSSAAAAASMPSLALFADSPFMSLARPTLCASDSECTAPGFACTDIEADLIGGDLGSALPALMQNPLAALAAGVAVEGSSPALGVGAFRQALRRLLRRLGGARGDGGSALRFCAPDFKAIAKNARDWAAGAQGTPCVGDTCLDLPAAPGGGPRSAPHSLPGLSGLALPTDMRPAPDAGDGLYSPFSADARAPRPGARAAAFIATFAPAAGAGAVLGGGPPTNALKARLRRALSSALDARGYPVQEEGLHITSLAPADGRQLAVSFEIVTPVGTGAATMAAIVAELTGGAPGSIGANAGTALALLGVVAAADAAGVSIRSAATSTTATSTVAPPASPTAAATLSTSPAASATLSPGAAASISPPLASASASPAVASSSSSTPEALRGAPAAAPEAAASSALVPVLGALLAVVCVALLVSYARNSGLGAARMAGRLFQQMPPRVGGAPAFRTAGPASGDKPSNVPINGHVSNNPVRIATAAEQSSRV